MTVTGLKDITERASKLKPGEAVLYKNAHPTGDDPPEYLAVARINQPGLFWVLAWPREVNGRVVIELRWTPKR
jgi:hypothetical protein